MTPGPPTLCMYYLCLPVIKSQGGSFLYWLFWITFPSPHHLRLARQNVLQTACTWNKSRKSNNNNDESAAERVLEKYINKSENSTDSALFSDIFCSQGACFIFYGYTTAIFSWYQSTTHIKTTDWCLKKHARVRLHVQLELISSNSQQDVVRLSGRICDLCGLIRLPRVVDASTRKSNTGGGGEVVQLHISMITHRRSISAISGGHVDTHSSDIIKFILQKLQAKCDSSQNVTVNSLNSEAICPSGSELPLQLDLTVTVLRKYH